MVNVIQCKTRAEMRAFFEMGKKAGFRKAERRYLKLYACPPLSPLSRNGEQAYLIAVRDGRNVFRALTGVDRKYIAVTGQNIGYFSLFDGENDREAMYAVLEKIISLHRAWGTEKITGPVSPDGSGFFMGAGEGGFQNAHGLFTGPDASHTCSFLRENGFWETQTENAYRVQVKNTDALTGLCEKAEERFCVNVSKMKPGIFRTRWKRDILACTPEAPRAELLTLLDRLRPYISKRYSFSACENGVCAGYLIGFSGKGLPVRGATLFTDTDKFSAPAALSLINAFLNTLRKNSVAETEVSVINTKNIRSERLVLRFGGEKTRAYIQFTKNVQ